MLGSHLDTVLDAGRYDGALGVLAAIAVVAELSRGGERLQHALEVAAFGEEEGTRFPTYILTSSALIGAVGPELMDRRDKDGISVREAVAAAGGSADTYLSCARKAGEIAADLELPIEQGPVLEQSGLALGAVTAINGSHRLSVTVSGFAGPAGTVPMWQRRDALAAASEMVLAIEHPASSDKALVATVGQIAALPGAQNVIPGKVSFSIDMRSPSDAVRDRAHRALLTTLSEIAARRGVALEAVTYQTNARTPLADGVIPAVLRGDCGLRPGAAEPALRRRSRCWDHGPALPGGYDVSALQGRHQPQSGRVDHGRGCRDWGVGAAGSDPPARSSAGGARHGMTDWQAKIAALVAENFAAETAFLRELVRRADRHAARRQCAACRSARPSCSRPWASGPSGMPLPPPR